MRGKNMGEEVDARLTRVEFAADEARRKAEDAKSLSRIAILLAAIAMCGIGLMWFR